MYIMTYMHAYVHCNTWLLEHIILLMRKSYPINLRASYMYMCIESYSDPDKLNSCNSAY